MPNKLTAFVSIGFWLIPCIIFAKIGWYGLQVCQKEITKPASAKTDGDRIGLGMLLVVAGAGLALLCWANMSHYVVELLGSPEPVPDAAPAWGD